MDASDLLFKECLMWSSNAVLHWVKNHKPVIEGYTKLWRYLLRMEVETLKVYFDLLTYASFQKMG